METSASGLSSPPDADDIIVARPGVPRTGDDTRSEPLAAPLASVSDEALAEGTESAIVPSTVGPIQGQTKESDLADKGTGASTTSRVAAAGTPNDDPSRTPIAPATGSKVTTVATPASSTRLQPRGGPGRPRGSRGRGGGRGRKRKRTRDADDDGDDDDDSDSSEVYTAAATQTKSGRSVHKPTTFVPPPSTTTHHSSATPGSGQKRKRVYRRNPESAVCKVCLRGTSPLTNMIVFCDGCNTAYHRYCHHPPIDQSVVDELDKEWYCAPCDAERHPPQASQTSSTIDPSTLISVDPTVSEDERRRFFASLSQDTLVALLTAVTTRHPSVAAFPPEFRSKERVAAAVTSTAASVNANGRRPSQDDVPDEHPPHYPRPGHGLMQTLPPDRDDSHYLVDEEDRYGVFSHVYQTDRDAANVGVNGSEGKKTNKPERAQVA